MTRIKHGLARHRKHKKVLKKMKGARGGRRKLYRTALETLHRAMVYSYRDRKRKKRTMRQLWITRIGAACKLAGISYSRFIDGLRKAKVGLDRKVLADIAVKDTKTFKELVKIAKTKK